MNIGDKIVSYLEKMPALSPTITKIIEISGSNKTSAGELIRVIKLDPVLTAKILKLINSAYFGMSAPVSSINRAIVLLGFNTIKNLALSAEVLSSFNPKEGSFDVNKFWEHNLACAVGCKIIAGGINSEKGRTEEYFIAGLIHDIGKIFLVKYFRDEYFDLVNEARNIEEVMTSEKVYFELTHAEIGALIAEKWKLSEELIISTKCHHDTSSCKKNILMPDIVFLLNIYCKKAGFEDMIGQYSMAGNDDIEVDWERIGLSKEVAESELSVLPEKVEESKVFLKIGQS